MRRIDIALIVLAALLVVALAVYLTAGFVGKTPGVNLQPQYPSSVTIEENYAWTASANLQNGVDFGLLLFDQLPLFNIQAPDNTNDGAGGSTLFITRDPISTVDIELCIRADGDMEQNPPIGQNIPLDGERYRSAREDPTPPGAYTPLTTTFAKISEVLDATNDEMFFQFELDVPSSGLPAGQYANNIEIAIVQAGDPC